VTGGRDDYARCAPLLERLAALGADDPERETLRHQLIGEYMPVAEHIARRYAGRGESPEDLLQVARVGLIHAVDRFEPDRGSDFLSFAVPTIMGEVRRHFRDTGWALRVPRRLKELDVEINRASNVLSLRLGRAPKHSELAEYLGLDVDYLREGLLASNAYNTLSIDKPVGHTEALSLADTFGEDDMDLANVEDRELVVRALKGIPGRERAILVMRFFGNMTQTQIAERMGISQMHVSRLLAQTLQQLRAILADEG
jgi:RNA polymerase sigma-B factor